MASFSISSNSGYAKATTFAFTTDADTLSSYTSFLWNFGDGGTSRNPNPSYIYKNQGYYTPTLNAYKDDGTYVSVTSSLNVSLFLNESLYFDTVPPPTFAGHLNRYPFRINITSSSTDEHYIDLGAQFSKSYQYQEPENKWSFLRPQWRFLDLSGNQINFIKTINTPIKIDGNGNVSPNGFVVGVTGTAQFYFVDDLYNTDLFIQNKSYSTIIATLRTDHLKSQHDSFNLDDKTPSYSNSKATVTVPHIFTWREPDNLKITQNGISPISNIKFLNQNNPIFVNFGFNSSYDQETFIDGNGTKIVDPNEFVNYVPFDGTTYYDLFSSKNVPISLSSLSFEGYPLNFVYSPSAIEFKFIDDNGFKVGGYYKGSFTNTQSAIDSRIDGSGYFPLPDLSSKFINPILWISNPNAGMFATAQYYYTPDSYNVNLGYMDKVHVKAFDMPILQPYDNEFQSLDLDGFPINAYGFAVSGIHGINSIAALPAPTYHAWVCDSELNKLYRINSIGDILVDIDLNSQLTKIGNDINEDLFLVPNQVSPNGVVLDSNHNVWVTLYNTPYVFKYDNNGNFLLKTEFASNENPRHLNWWRDVSDISSTSSATDDSYPIQPTYAETDLDDNVWVTYSNPFSGFLVKYSTTGSLISSFQYPLCSCPEQIICDNENNIWITLTNNVGNNSGFLQKRNSFGTIVSSFSGFNGINHLTLDVNQNPWFTYSYQWVGTIDTKTGSFSALKITDNSYSDDVPEWFDANYNADETSLEGIASDLLGRIYVINSIENKVFIIDSNTQQIVDRFYINPKGFVYSLSAQYAPTELEYNPWSKSALATGDWSGFRWANKYYKKQFNNTLYKTYSGTTYKAISGTTLPNYISFYPEGYYDIFKVNENFDMASNMKSVAFQTCLQESKNLFNNFLGSIFGNEPLQHDDLGVVSYEKIANFISNKSDIDTCNVDDLYDISDSLDLNTDDFRLNFPVEMKKIMDLFSINQSKLFGGELYDYQNFKTANEYSNFNRGEKLKTSSYIVSAGIPVILKERSLDSYNLIQTGTINNNLYYNLNVLANHLNLNNDWSQYYDFYEFIPSSNVINMENVIDWDNTNFDKQNYISSLKNQLSGAYPNSYLKWDTNNGMMEYFFTYQLYKGLGLIS